MKTQVHSVHLLRRQARREERRVQRILDPSVFTIERPDEAIPMWAKGVRVERVGTGLKRYVQWAVALTDRPGR